jgi:hypothetical protein
MSTLIKTNQKETKEKDQKETKEKDQKETKEKETKEKETKEKDQKETKETKEKKKIVLLGDSVLDNFAWIMDPMKNNLTDLLRTMSDYEIVNLAVDQMTTFDLEKRMPQKNPWAYYQRARDKLVSTAKKIYKYQKNQDEQKHQDEQKEEPIKSSIEEKYLVDENDGNIYSFKNLEKLKNVYAVVLSIGKNDVYLQKEIQKNLTQSLIPGRGHKRQKVVAEFGQRYRHILKNIRQATTNETIIIPVIQYHPHYQFSLVHGSSSADKSLSHSQWLTWSSEKIQYLCLSKLVSPLAKEILSIVFESGQNLQVIDLSKTFDRFDEGDYGTGKIGQRNSLGVNWSGVEPSDKSSNYIAQLIDHICSTGVPQPSIFWLQKNQKEKKEQVVSHSIISPDLISTFVF